MTTRELAIPFSWRVAPLPEEESAQSIDPQYGTEIMQRANLRFFARTHRGLHPKAVPLSAPCIPGARRKASNPREVFPWLQEVEGAEGLSQ